MKKLICSLFVLFLGMSAFANPDSIVKNAVNKSEISQTALIGVSFKDLETKASVVDYNSTLPMSAASVQKLVTTIPALNKLGEKYEFKTQLYKDKNKNLYVKLGADPYFTSKNLRNMVKAINLQSLNAVYIDDTITDRIEWGEGWQWDNTLNTYMPKFGAYNIDANVIGINIRPTTMNSPAEIYTTVFYPIIFENNVLTGDVTDLKFQSRDYVRPDFINISGTVAQKTVKIIPVNDLRKYFILRLKEAFKNNKIAYYGKFDRKKVPSDAKLITESKSGIENVIYDILQKSNNMMSETLFKVAGGGSEEKAIQMFKDYYEKEGISTDSIKITDASGVSKNNLLNTDFVTSVLVNDYSKINSIKKYMAYPGVGTLENRMYYLKGKLYAKTGTLQNVSAIAGYLTVDSGKTYAFCIIVNDPKSTESEKKEFEEYVLRTAYEKL